MNLEFAILQYYDKIIGVKGLVLDFKFITSLFVLGGML